MLPTVDKPKHLKDRIRTARRLLGFTCQAMYPVLVKVTFSNCIQNYPAKTNGHPPARCAFRGCAKLQMYFSVKPVSCGRDTGHDLSRFFAFLSLLPAFVLCCCDLGGVDCLFSWEGEGVG